MQERVAFDAEASKAPPPPWLEARRAATEEGLLLPPVSELFLSAYKTMGPVYRFKRAKQEFTVISGVEANRFMARHGRTHLHARDYRREQNEELGVEETIVSLDGEAHQELRRLQKHGFSVKAIAHKLPLLVEATRRLVDAWQPGDRLLVKAVMPQIVAEQLGYGVLTHPTGDRLEDLLIFVRTLVAETVARIRPKTVLRMPLYRNAKTRCMALADEVLEAHKHPRGDGAAPDLVDDLLRGYGAYEGLRSEQELRVGVLGGYIGGLDTVSSTCCFLVHGLLSHPDILERVMDEIDGAFDGGRLTLKALGGMRTLHAAMLETLRMYPVAAAVQGTAAVSFAFAGHRIEAGANLIVATTVPHHLPEHFPEPGRFDPDRHLPPRAGQTPAGVFAPYGAGAHVCLGVGMAEALIKLTVATILERVSLAIDPSAYALQIDAVLTPVPKDFHVLVVARRT